LRAASARGAGRPWSWRRWRSPSFCSRAPVCSCAARRAELFDPGFRTHGIAIAEVAAPSAQGGDPSSTARFLHDVRAALLVLPGVSSVTWSNLVPLGGDREQIGLEIPRHRGPNGESVITVAMSTVGPDYFETLEIPVLAGRGFVDDDFAAGRPGGVIVNRAFAQRYFGAAGAADVLGELLGLAGGGPQLPIVGVVADARIHSLGEEPRPFVHVPIAGERATFFVATDGDAHALLGAMRRAIAEQDPLVLPQRLTTLAELRRTSLFVQRALGSLTGVLAILALALTGLGVYGSVSFAVARRHQELGLRMALGARPARVVRLVLARAGRLVALGVSLGVAGGALGGRALSGLLFEVAPFDPTTFAVATLLIGAAVAVASYFPARRALRVNPLEALKQD
jgi:hypothetical protein